MRNYEMMMIFDPDHPLDESKKFLHDILDKNKVKITKEKDIGTRDLAYQINKKKRGHYILLNMEADQKILVSIQKEFKIFKGIMRQLITIQDS